MPGNYPSRGAQRAGTESARRAASVTADRTAASLARQALANRGAKALARQTLAKVAGRGVGLLIPFVDVALLAYTAYELYRWFNNPMVPVGASYGYSCASAAWGPSQGVTTCGQFGVSPTPGVGLNQFVAANTWGAGNPPAGNYDVGAYWDSVPDGAHIVTAVGESAWVPGTSQFGPSVSFIEEPFFHPAQYPQLWPEALPIQAPAPAIKPLPWSVAREVGEGEPSRQFDWPMESDAPFPWVEERPEFPYFVPMPTGPQPTAPRRPIVLPFGRPRGRGRKRKEQPPPVGRIVDPEWPTDPFAHTPFWVKPKPSPHAQAATKYDDSISWDLTNREISFGEHGREPAKKNVREFKVRSNRAALTVWSIFNYATEARDLVNALYWSLPQLTSKKGKKYPKYAAFNDWQRFLAVWKHHDEVDIVEAIKNFQNSNLGDRFAAGSGRARAAAQEHLDTGALAGPNAGGIRPTLGTQQKDLVDAVHDALVKQARDRGAKVSEKQAGYWEITGVKKVKTPDTYKPYPKSIGFHKIGKRQPKPTQVRAPYY